MHREPNPLHLEAWIKRKLASTYCAADDTDATLETMSSAALLDVSDSSGADLITWTNSFSLLKTKTGDDQEDHERAVDEFRHRWPVLESSNTIEEQKSLT